MKKVLITVFLIILMTIGLYSFTAGFNFSKTKCCEDVLFNNFVMEHTYNALFNGSYKGNLYTLLSFYGKPFSIGRSDNLLGTAPVYYIFRAFAEPIHSFLFWEMSMFVLNFLSFYFFLRKF